MSSVLTNGLHAPGLAGRDRDACERTAISRTAPQSIESVPVPMTLARRGSAAHAPEDPERVLKMPEVAPEPFEDRHNGAASLGIP